MKWAATQKKYIIHYKYIDKCMVWIWSYLLLLWRQKRQIIIAKGNKIAQKLLELPTGKEATTNETPEKKTRSKNAPQILVKIISQNWLRWQLINGIALGNSKVNLFLYLYYYFTFFYFWYCCCYWLLLLVGLVGVRRIVWRQVDWRRSLSLCDWWWIGWVKHKVTSIYWIHILLVGSAAGFDIVLSNWDWNGSAEEIEE